MTSYEMAKEKYAAWGVDTEKAMEQLKKVPVSLHCWQLDDVMGFDNDGALTGGMAYEALNNASKLKSNLIIVLNDNKMSISENVGGVSRYLSGLRTAESYQGLKNGITNSLNSIPKYGDQKWNQAACDSGHAL